MQSDYWSRVDVAARVVYSDASSVMPNYGSLFSGLETRTATVIQNIIAPPGGGADSDRLSLTADMGVTVRLTDKFSIVDQFRYNNFRVPGNWLYMTNSFFGPTLGATPNIYSAASCSTVTSPDCPQHTSSSGADVIADSLTDFLRQAITLNTFEVEYEASPRYSGYIGYRFTRRNITDNNSDNQVSVFYPTLPNRGSCAGQPLVNGVCTVATVLEAENDFVQINGNSGLLGITARPTDKWRINGDVEIYTADNAFTRISPRHLQLYKVKAIYRPKDWVNLGGSGFYPGESEHRAGYRKSAAQSELCGQCDVLARRIPRSASMFRTITTTSSRRPTSVSSPRRRPRAHSAAGRRFSRVCRCTRKVRISHRGRSS